MPRIRTIKPEFASDRKMASVSREARLTFILLITQADDDGLVLGSPRQLLGQLYPHDESVDLATLSRELRELRDAGFIVMRETHDEAPVVQIANWSKHQKVDHKGKSLILNTLRPVDDAARDILASVSRESRAPTLDLGPRTVDLGPTSSPAVAVAPRADRKPKAEPRYPHFPPDVCGRLYDKWTEVVGRFEYPRFRKAMALLFDKPADALGHTEAEVATAISCAVAWADAADRYAKRPFERGRLTPETFVQRFPQFLGYAREGMADAYGGPSAFAAYLSNAPSPLDWAAR